MPSSRKRALRHGSRSRFRAECHERTARGLIEALSPVSGIPAALETDLVYRGHGSSKYGLVSNAHRKGSLCELCVSWI